MMTKKFHRGPFTMQFLIVFFVSMLISITSVVHAELPKYSVKDLLSPCAEGETNPRWGEALQLECDQYIRGFTDAVSRYAVKKVCVPKSVSRVDLIRKVFVNWAKKNQDKHHWPATKGLAAAIRSSINCVN